MCSARVLTLLSVLALVAACAEGSAPIDPSGSGGNSSLSSSSSSSASNSSSGSSSATSSASSSSGEGGGPSVKTNSLLSLNLHCLRLDGTVYATNADRFAAIAALVAKRDISAIALQEVCQRPGENAMSELEAAIEKATMASWEYVWAFAHIAWEGTPDQADEGVAVLARGDITNLMSHQHVVQGSLHRVATSARLPSEWADMRLTSVHFEVFEESARKMQARDIAAVALVDTDPIFGAMVAGDFNDIEGSATHSAFPAMGYIAANAGLDPAGIDHVMIHRASPFRPVKSEKVFLGAEAVSDHPGILVVFEAAQGDNVTITRVRTLVNPGGNQFLSIRGNVAPLTWDLGFPFHIKPGGSRFFVTTELQGNFEFKLLLDDQTWQMGPNELSTAGQDQTVTPTF
jgi:endonuclease/exonuclease/phosphatase family metal-dependent hydrolase